MNLKSFLKKETSNSCEWLVVNMAEKLKSASFDTVAAMFIAATHVFRGRKKEEELRLLGLLVVSRFGEKGEPLPGLVEELIFGSSQVPAPATPSATVIKSAPVPTPVATATPAAMQSVKTAPARTLEVVSNDQVLNTWRGQLKAVAGGNTDKTLLIGATNLTTRIFTELIPVLATDWPLLFSAVKAANKNGTSIINNKIAGQPFFDKAPTALVREYVFADGGVLASVVSNLTDLRGKMESWIQMKADVLLNAVCSLGRRAGLSEQEIKSLDELLALAKGKAAPKWIIEKIAIAIATSKQPVATAPAKTQVEKVSGLENLGQLLGQSDSAPKTATAVPAATPAASHTAEKKANKKKAFKMSLGVPNVPAEKFAKPEDIQKEATTVEPPPVAPIEAVAEPEMVSVGDGKKPVALDPEFEAQFAALQLEEERKLVAAASHSNGHAADNAVVTAPPETPAEEVTIAATVQ